MAHLVSAFGVLRARVVNVWPETSTHGVYHVMQLARLSLDDLIGASLLPCAAFDLLPGTASPFGDMASGIDDGLLTVSYVAKDDVSVDAMLGKLEALRDNLWADRNLGAAGAQVAEYPRVSYSVDSFLNRYFTNTQRPFIAGSVLVRLVCGEYP